MKVQTHPIYPITRRDITGSPSGPVINYQLTPEEHEQYKALPPQQKHKAWVTTAKQHPMVMQWRDSQDKRRRKGGEGRR
jgi:hypothetical protein